ncbi:MAG: AAA family ATPase [Bacteroidales bacterium]|nr:AAA family ATPase [Bacteroidales bacterium]
MKISSFWGCIVSINPHFNEDIFILGLHINKFVSLQSLSNIIVMDKNFIGREQEIKLLQSIMDSGKAEFVAVYGRRRVGKTYLIQQFFNNSFAFSATGIIDGNSEEELYAFNSAMIGIGYSGRQPKTWLEAFDALKTVLEKQPHRGRQVIYIDELPCFDTPKSGFVRALGYFWNTWASLRKDVILIVCGSATSWMIENIVGDHGGLHNRITHTIYLRQFTLSETEKYFKSRKILWPRQLIVEAYMMLGGVPYYLSLLDGKESLAQNIDRLYFRKNSELSQEYRRLYASLFKSPEPYVRIVEALNKNKQGMTRKEIAESLKIPSSGTLSKHLENLQYCDIIRRYVSKVGGKSKVNDAYYQLVDLFSLFHLSFSKRLTTEDYWQQRLNTPAINSWYGLAFEHVCMAHISQIRHALGLDRIAVEYYSWRSNKTPKSQVDMIIERADHLINLCEIKYTQSEYVITADEDQKFRNRSSAFILETKNRCGILPTWITPYGLHNNEYSATVQYQVTMDDLFVSA